MSSINSFVKEMQELVKTNNEIDNEVINHISISCQKDMAMTAYHTAQLVFNLQETLFTYVSKRHPDNEVIFDKLVDLSDKLFSINELFDDAFLNKMTSDLPNSIYGIYLCWCRLYVLTKNEVAYHTINMFSECIFDNPND